MHEARIHDGAGARALAPGVHLVATPIGTARDITLRALDALTEADLLLAEDTRTLRHLMAIHAVPLNGRRILACHDHNWAEVAPTVMQALAEGASVAFCSDAGTPGIADPGFEIVRAALAAGHPVNALPGASAALVGLTVSGLPTDRFLFAGFPPSRAAARKQFVEGLRNVEATLVLFESPRRVKETLRELCDGLGSDRNAAVCRELTKRFEQVHRATLGALLDGVDGWVMKGEFVIVIDRPGATTADPARLDADLADALSRVSLRDAVDEVAQRHKIGRREVYERALALRRAE
jgi:16S rRNA (cytidine1402-2'-O)-methyltransferase